MAGNMQAYNKHCLVVPYPTQGHINPMLQFARLLEHRGIKVTLVVTLHILDAIEKSSKLDSTTSNIAIDTISDGKEDGNDQDLDHQTYLARLKVLGSKTLKQLVEKYRSSNFPVNGIVYDAFMPWALDVAKKFELFGAVFITQSCAVSNIYNFVYEKKLKLPLEKDRNAIAIPGLPILEATDLPSFIHDFHRYPGVLDVFANQFSNVDRADSVLINTFDKLEEKEILQLGKLWPVKAIGPTVPTIYTDEKLHKDRDYGVNVYTPDNGACMKWINEKNQGSVVFVSFGSTADLSSEQMEELALALQSTEKYFLWVVRNSESTKLPKGFLMETSEKGLVVSWCPQLEVLANKAIGCFVTHCGWNSTLEAISSGVPMVAVPQWTDQSTNAKYMMDVWENGIKAKAGVNGIVGREELGHCIREVMQGEKGKKIRSNAEKWKELAYQAVDNGGNSDKNITDFVNQLAAK